MWGPRIFVCIAPLLRTRVQLFALLFCWSYKPLHCSGTSVGLSDSSLNGFDPWPQCFKVHFSSVTMQQSKGIWASTKNASEPFSLHPKLLPTLSPNALEPEPTTVAQASETGTSSHIVLVALSPVRRRDIRTWRFKRISINHKHTMIYQLNCQWKLIEAYEFIN